MSFYHINVKTIRKWIDVISNLNFFFRSSLWVSLTQVHKRWKNIQVQLMNFSHMNADRRTDRQTYMYPPLDKRYSPIIYTICGPNNTSTCLSSRLDTKICVTRSTGWKVENAFMAPESVRIWNSPWVNIFLNNFPKPNIFAKFDTSD